MNKERVSMIAAHTTGVLTFILLAVVAEYSARWWTTARQFDRSVLTGFTTIGQASFWTLVAALFALGTGALALTWALRTRDVLRARIAMFTAIAALVGAIVAIAAAFVASPLA